MKCAGVLRLGGFARPGFWAGLGGVVGGHMLWWGGSLRVAGGCGFRVSAGVGGCTASRVLKVRFQFQWNSPTETLSRTLRHPELIIGVY